MFKSTVKKSNTINNLLFTQTQNKTSLNKINFDNNLKKPKTFLFEDTKKRLIPKFGEDKHLFYTKSEINFRSKNNEAFNEPKNNINNNKNNDFHSIKKEKFLQKLKDMIFSPGDIINNNGKEQKENGGTYNNTNIKYSKNIFKQINTSKINPKVNLLPNKIDNKKTLVLDLDETLIHSAFEPFNPKDDIKLTMKMKEEDITIHVLKRPYLDEFLNIVAQKYEVVIFTASISDYANPLLDQLDPCKKISHRLFREHCTKSDNGLFIKDLNRLGRNLKDVIIIDNNPVSFTFNKANGLPILTWHSIQSDDELIKLIPLLTYLSNPDIDDVRPVINKVVNGYYINYKEVNQIINNNNNKNSLNNNNNNKEDDYFNNWFPNTIKKMEKKNSFKYSANREKDKNNDNSSNMMTNIKRKESFEQLIKYKGLLGSKEEFNFDNYKKSRHTKLFSGFLNNNKNGIIDNNFNINNTNNGKSLFMELNEGKNKFFNEENKNDNYDSLYNSRLDKKRNHSSKNLIKIKKNVNNDNTFNYFNAKKITKEKTLNKNRDISFTKYNADLIDDSKLNKTDTNINLNKNVNNQNIIINNNSKIMNNNIFVINDKQPDINKNNENNNTIEYSNRDLFNEQMNKSFKNGYKSANFFYRKKERAQSAEYKKREINQNNDLSKLLDNLINYNKSNKRMNINSNQLVAVSNNYLNNQNLDKINHLILNKATIEKDLYSLYNMRINNEKSNYMKKSNLLNEFNNKVGIYKININNYNSYKNSKSNIYVDTGNNLENYSNKSIKRSFLYNENKHTNKNNNDYNSYKIMKHLTKIGHNKSINYLSPTSNFKMNLYK